MFICIASWESMMMQKKKKEKEKENMDDQAIIFLKQLLHLCLF